MVVSFLKMTGHGLRFDGDRIPALMFHRVGVEVSVRLAVLPAYAPAGHCP